MDVTAHEDRWQQLALHSVDTGVARPRAGTRRVVAATLCALLGHRAFTSGLPTGGQCCRRCYTLRGEDTRRWSRG